MSDRVTPLPSPQRARSSSNVEHRDRSNSTQLHDQKRQHSMSVLSVLSRMSDAYEYPRKCSYDFNAIDLEKQLILTAANTNGGVWCLIMKIFLLCAVVLGCGVLVFYAL